MLTVVANPPAPSTPGVILFVDDERRVLTSMRAMFRRGYTVLTANSAAEGLEIISQRTVDVVVSDQRMPEMTGVEMLTEIKQRSPHTMRILLTGYADLEAIEASINDCEVFRYLMKPCPPDQLRDSVSQALSAARAAQEEAGLMPEEPSCAPEAALSADVVMLHADAVPDELFVPTTGPVAEAAPALLEPAQPSNDEHWDDSDQQEASPVERVDVLVLSADPALQEAICDAAQSLADETQVHRAVDTDAALDVLASAPVGVLITDIAISEAAVTALTTELKQQVPTLVTILAADRSDASLLINLINHGQVFRFLLKPIPVGQCRLWLSSARKRHLELAASDAERLRYAPQQLEQSEDESSGTDQSDWSSLDYDADGGAPGSARDFSAQGIRSQISTQLNRFKQRFSRWSKRHG
ncbi:MAG: response regulator [Pseudomonadales bacterium]